jgi:hypothetical protein
MELDRFEPLEPRESLGAGFTQNAHSKTDLLYGAIERQAITMQDLGFSEAKL